MSGEAVVREDTVRACVETRRPLAALAALADKSSQASARREAARLVLQVPSAAAAAPGAGLDARELDLRDDEWAAELCRGALLPALSALSLSGNLWLRDPLRGCVNPLEKLVELDFSDCIRVGDAALATVARTLPRLEALDVSCCYEVTDAGLAMVVDALDRLERLRLSGCSQITDAGVRRLAARHATALRELDISGLCLVTDLALLGADLDAGGGGGAWRKLEAFACIGCAQLTDAGVGAVTDRCIGFSLRSLRVAGLRHIGDALFVGPTAPAAFRALALLDVEGCLGLRGEALTAALSATRAPRLEHLRADACPAVAGAALVRFRAARPAVHVDASPHPRMTRLDEGLESVPSVSHALRVTLTAVRQPMAALAVGFWALSVNTNIVPPHLWLYGLLALALATALYVALALLVLVLAAGM
jgi:hypothetical protein